MKYYKIKICGIARVYNTNINIIWCVYMYNHMCMSISLFSCCHTIGIQFYKEQKEFRRLQANYWLLQSFTLG